MACDRSVDPISPSQLINSVTNLLAQLYLLFLVLLLLLCFCLCCQYYGTWKVGNLKTEQEQPVLNSRVHSCCAYWQINGHNKMIIVLASIEYWFDANNNDGRMERRARAARPIKDKCNIFFSVRQKPSWIVSKIRSQGERWQWGG